MIKKQERVAIIGAGPAGLLCARRMKKEGIDFIIFESKDELGGIWVYRPGITGRIYQSLYTNSTKSELALDGLEFRKSAPPYPNHFQVLDYIKDFADKYHLTHNIMFNCNVIKIQKRLDNSGWDVTIVNHGRKEMMFFDKVIIATGQCNKPFWPDVKNLHTLRKNNPNIIHSSQYRSPHTYFGKNVLIVGLGTSSGSDIAHTLTLSAKKIDISIRSERYMQPRLIFGVPWWTLLGNSNLLLYVPFAKKLQNIIRSILLKCREILITGGHRWKTPGTSYYHAVKNALPINRDGFDLPRCFSLKKINKKPVIDHINEFTAQTESSSKKYAVTFSDASVSEYDSIIFCTGYSRNLPFDIILRDGTQLSSYPLKLIDYIFLENDKDIAFCLVAHPIGPHWMLAETEADVICRAFTNTIDFPSSPIIDVLENEGEKNLVIGLNHVNYLRQTYLNYKIPSFIQLMKCLFINAHKTWRYLKKPMWTRMDLIGSIKESGPDYIEDNYLYCSNECIIHLNRNIHKLLNSIKKLKYFSTSISSIYLIGDLVHGGFTEKSSTIDVLIVFNAKINGSNNSLLIQKIVDNIDDLNASTHSIIKPFFSFKDDLISSHSKSEIGAFWILDLIVYGKLIYGNEIRDRIPETTTSDALSLSNDIFNKLLDSNVMFSLTTTHENNQININSINDFIFVPIAIQYYLNRNRYGNINSAVTWYINTIAKNNDKKKSLLIEALVWREKGLVDQSAINCDFINTLYSIYEETFQALQNYSLKCGYIDLAKSSSLEWLKFKTTLNKSRVKISS